MWPVDIDGQRFDRHVRAAFSRSASIRSTRSDSFSVLTFSRSRATISGNANGVGFFGCVSARRLSLMRCSATRMRLEFQFLQHHFLLGLREQQIAAVVLAEDFVEQSARRLQLPRAFLLPRMPLIHQPRHARDLAKTPRREFRRIEARENVVLQILGREEAVLR